MHLTNIGLLFITGLDWMIAILILIKKMNHKANISIALYFFLLGIWSFGTAMFRESAHEAQLVFWSWISSLGIAFSLVPLYLFSIYYPYSYRVATAIEKLFLFLYIMAMFFVIFLPGIFFGKPYFLEPPNSGYTAKSGYWFFIIIYILFFVSFLRNLLPKYQVVSGFQKDHIRLVMFGVGIAFVVMGVMGIFLPGFLASWRYWHWVGHYPVLAVLGIMGYILFFFKVKENGE